MSLTNKLLTLMLISIHRILSQTIESVATQPESASQQALQMTRRIKFSSNITPTNKINTNGNIAIFSKSENKLWELDGKTPSILVKSTNLPLNDVINSYYLQERKKDDNSLTGNFIGFYLTREKIYKTTYPSYDYPNEDGVFNYAGCQENAWIDSLKDGASMIFLICPRKSSPNGPGDDWGYVNVYTMDNLIDPSE